MCRILWVLANTKPEIVLGNPRHIFKIQASRVIGKRKQAHQVTHMGAEVQSWEPFPESTLPNLLLTLSSYLIGKNTVSDLNLPELLNLTLLSPTEAYFVIYLPIWSFIFNPYLLSGRQSWSTGSSHRWHSRWKHHSRRRRHGSHGRRHERWSLLIHNNNNGHSYSSVLLQIII